MEVVEDVVLTSQDLLLEVVVDKEEVVLVPHILVAVQPMELRIVVAEVVDLQEVMVVQTQLVDPE